MKKTVISAVLLVLAAFCLFGCASESADKKKRKENRTYSETNGALGGVDSLGRVVELDCATEKERGNKTVGVFYFLWLGQDIKPGPYNNTEIVAKNPEAVNSPSNWTKAGGGALYQPHFWGEPLFGYYTSGDEWVYRKHVQMLTDAGVDFICFDTTNAVTYTSCIKKLISVWYEYLEAGYDVPKLTFYTHTKSGETMNALYQSIYTSKSLNEKYPRLSELWFNYEGKPMIIGNKYDKTLKDEVKEYFRIKDDVWPTDQYTTDDAIPWMEFSRLLSDDAVYGVDGKKEVVNVSIAQHSATCMMSMTAWYGANDRTRSWHDGKNDTSENAVLYGYNFQEQWDWAMSVDPDMVFITGFNEWIAYRQNDSNGHITFVDCCDVNTSRDCEPMKGLFGDNYFMQLIENVRKYKGVKDPVDVGDDVTIDINGDFSQWDAAKAVYTDYKGDTADRNASGFGSLKYVDTSGRNDITLAKTAKDADNIYFYVETAENLTPETDENWMTLFINSGSQKNKKWENQFDYVIRFDASAKETSVEKYNGNGWEKAGTVQMKKDGNKMMLSVPKKLISVGKTIDIQFKWADNYDINDVFSFYTKGDAAPIGRLCYVFSEK